MHRNVGVTYALHRVVSAVGLLSDPLPPGHLLRSAPLRLTHQVLSDTLPHLGARVYVSEVLLSPGRLLADRGATWGHVELTPDGWLLPKRLRELLVQGGVMQPHPISIDLHGLNVVAEGDTAWAESTLTWRWHGLKQSQPLRVEVTPMVPVVEMLQQPVLDVLGRALAQNIGAETLRANLSAPGGRAQIKVVS